MIDLHRHKIDHSTIPSQQGNGIPRRTDDVFDCWFESGSMPYCQLHYDFENKEFFKEGFLADFVAEGTTSFKLVPLFTLSCFILFRYAVWRSFRVMYAHVWDVLSWKVCQIYYLHSIMLMKVPRDLTMRCHLIPLLLLLCTHVLVYSVMSPRVKCNWLNYVWAPGN